MSNSNLSIDQVLERETFITTKWSTAEQSKKFFGRILAIVRELDFPSNGETPWGRIAGLYNNKYNRDKPSCQHLNGRVIQIRLEKRNSILKSQCKNAKQIFPQGIPTCFTATKRDLKYEKLCNKVLKIIRSLEDIESNRIPWERIALVYNNNRSPSEKEYTPCKLRITLNKGRYFLRIQECLKKVIAQNCTKQKENLVEKSFIENPSSFSTTIKNKKRKHSLDNEIYKRSKNEAHEFNKKELMDLTEDANLLLNFKYSTTLF